ncbi:unnamed protein product [Camellia sinensis]
MRRERERSNECINPRQPSVTPNWPAPTTPSRNVGVVIRDEHDLNVIRVRAAKEKEKVNPMSKGKEKVTSSGKRMTNACQVDWIKKFTELKRRNTTSLLRWGCNKVISISKYFDMYISNKYTNLYFFFVSTNYQIVVHVPHWGCIQVDSKTFSKVMRRKFGQIHV